MPGFLFQTGPRYRPVSEPDIMALAGLKEYAVADEHFRPDVWVYFDFLRPTVFYTDVVQLGGETISVEQLEGQGLFATERAVEIVDFYFDIFEKFFQVESGRERKAYSSGLGLTFCKLVVEKHQGQIGVEGGDPGSIFWFELPK